MPAGPLGPLGPASPVGPLLGRHVRLEPLGDHHRQGLLAAAVERLGASFEGVLRSYQPAADGPWPRDTAMYSILADEWPEVSARLRRALAR